MHVFSCKNMFFTILILIFFIYFFIFIFYWRVKVLKFTHIMYEKLVSFFWIKMFKNKAKIAPEST